MRHAVIAVVASLLFTGCSNYWWLARMLPVNEVAHPNDRDSSSRTYQEPPPNPSSEPVYGPDRTADAPAAKQEEPKSASDTP